MAQYSFLTPALTALLLTATPPAAQEFRPIDTADDFAVQVTGKTLRWDRRNHHPRRWHHQRQHAERREL